VAQPRVGPASELFQCLSRFVCPRKGLAQFEGRPQALPGAGHVPILPLHHPKVVLDDRVLGELLGRLFDQAHSLEIGVLLVIDPAQGVRNAWWTFQEVFVRNPTLTKLRVDLIREGKHTTKTFQIR
jgi:hypothetical protein